MERVNRDIKTIFEISFGSTNFTRVRNRVIFSINDSSPILYHRKSSSNKKSEILEENTKNTKINNLVSVKIKEWILSTPIILEVLLRLFYRSTYSLKFKGHTPIFLKLGFATYSDYFRVPH